MNIELPAELEKVLADEARKQGTTPEALVLDNLRRLFTPEQYYKEKYPPKEGSLYDSIKDIIGRVEGTGEPLSTEHSRYFGEYLLEKKKQGRL
jgi:hypothetical protein